MDWNTIAWLVACLVIIGLVLDSFRVSRSMLAREAEWFKIKHNQEIVIYLAANREAGLRTALEKANEHNYQVRQSITLREWNENHPDPAYKQRIVEGALRRGLQLCIDPIMKSFDTRDIGSTQPLIRNLRVGLTSPRFAAHEFDIRFTMMVPGADLAAVVEEEDVAVKWPSFGPASPPT